MVLVQAAGRVNVAAAALGRIEIVVGLIVRVVCH
jgi:hypothetical protein